MNKMNCRIKLLFALFAGVIAIAILPSKAYADVSYAVDDDGTAYAWNYSYPHADTITIKSEYKGYPVTKILPNTFSMITDFKSVTIPASVTSIGNNAFYGCTALQKINFESGSKLETIGSDAFSGCTSLNSLDIPASVTAIGTDAFKGTPWLDTKKNSAAGKLLIINNLLLDATACQDKVVKVPFGVTEICDNAFNLGNEEHNYNNDEIILPNTVKRIGNNAFFYNSINKINIPSSVVIIGDNAFYGCGNLDISFENMSSVIEIGESAFALTKWISDQSAKDPFVVINGMLVDASTYSGENMVIPSTVKRILGDAICGTYKNYAVKSITIPSSVTEICKKGFENCKNLVNVTIPESVEIIGAAAFGSCEALETISIPSSVKAIKDNVFSGCDSLKYVVLPNSNVSIGTDVFYRCKNLKGIFYNGAINLGSLKDGVLKFKYEFIDGKAVITNVLNSEMIDEFESYFFPASIYGKPVSVSDDVKKLFGEDNLKHDCGGGQATCISKAKCALCGKEYGEFGDHVKQSGYSYDANNHYKKCVNCGKELESHKHDLKTTDVKATFTSDGLFEIKCADCGMVQSSTQYYAASKLSFAKDSLTYTGKNIKPKFIAKDSKGKTISSSYYTVSFPKTSKKIGTYNVKITLKGGHYTGTKTLQYKIVPEKTKLVSIKAGSKSFTVKWQKKTTEVSGYEIQYALKKNFKDAKSLTVKSSKTTSKTVKKLKAKKKYYVRVRTFKTVKSKKYYSDWSTTKTVKVK